MKHLALLSLLALTACAEWNKPMYDKPPCEKQPALNYDMSCKQIKAAQIEAHASLARIKERRNTVTDTDVAVFILSVGTPNYACTIAQSRAEERIAVLESAMISRKCKP